MTRQITYHYNIESLDHDITVEGFEYASDKQAEELGPYEMALELGLYKKTLGPVKIYRVAASFGGESYYEHDPVEIPEKD